MWWIYRYNTYAYIYIYDNNNATPPLLGCCFTQRAQLTNSHAKAVLYCNAPIRLRAHKRFIVAFLRNWALEAFKVNLVRDAVAVIAADNHVPVSSVRLLLHMRQYSGAYTDTGFARAAPRLH